MARPRVHVNHHGRPVKANTGISLHKGSGRYYIVLDGTRQYFATWDEARAALALEQARGEAPTLLPQGGLISHRDGRVTVDPRIEEQLDAITARYRRDVVAGNVPRPRAGERVHFGPFAVADTAALRQSLFEQLTRDPAELGEQLGLDISVRRKGERPARSVQGPKLTAIGAAWVEHQEARLGKKSRYVEEISGRWVIFCRTVGNVGVAELTPDHFRRFHRAMLERCKIRAPKAHNELCAAPKAVLRWARRKFPDWGIHADVLEWADSYDRKRYKPSADNRKPISPEDFRAMIATCKRWQAIDVDGMPTNTNAARGRKRQAGQRQRAGFQLEAILRLALNAALDNVDVERIEWSNLLLDGEAPHMNFPRRKVEHLVGQPVSRITPLLPATVEALQAWKRESARTDGQVFKSAAAGAFTRSRLCRIFTESKKAAGCVGRFTFKALRNVAPTIAHQQFKSRDLADMILGHQLPSTARFYIGDLTSPEPLRELVDAIGVAYFSSNDQAAPCGPSGRRETGDQ